MVDLTAVLANKVQRPNDPLFNIYDPQGEDMDFVRDKVGGWFTKPE